jgi:hypothetical protein
MATANRLGKSLVPDFRAIRDLPKADYDSSYVLWTMGAPIGSLAEQLQVQKSLLHFSFRVRREMGEQPLFEPRE